MRSSICLALVAFGIAGLMGQAIAQDEGFTIIQEKSGKVHKGVILEEKETEIIIRTWVGDKRIPRDAIVDFRQNLTAMERDEILRGLNPTRDEQAWKERDKGFAGKKQVNTPKVLNLKTRSSAPPNTATGSTENSFASTGTAISANPGHWAERMSAALDKRVTLELSDDQLTDALNLIRNLTDVNIIVSPKVEELKPTVSLNVRDMDVATVLKWLTRLTGTFIDVRDQALYITNQKPKEVDDDERMDLISMMARAGVEQDLLPPEGTPMTDADRMKIAMAIWEKTNPKPPDFPGPSFGIMDEQSNQPLNPFAPGN